MDTFFIQNTKWLIDIGDIYSQVSSPQCPSHAPLCCSLGSEDIVSPRVGSKSLQDFSLNPICTIRFMQFQDKLDPRGHKTLHKIKFESSSGYYFVTINLNRCFFHFLSPPSTKALFGIYLFFEINGVRCVLDFFFLKKEYFGRVS